MNLPPLKFFSFREAISYRSKCPLCQSLLYINDRDLATDYGHEYRGGKERISFFIDQRVQDTITIDPDTDEVELVYNERLPEAIYTGTSSTVQRMLTPNYSGRFLHALTIDCKTCCQYNFTLQIHFDLSEQRLSGTYLNSESISIEECDMVHEIKNCYAIDKTEYSYFHKDGNSKKSQLPLIPLDLDNPKETVFRIRKLLIFS